MGIPANIAGAVPWACVTGAVEIENYLIYMLFKYLCLVMKNKLVENFINNYLLTWSSLWNVWIYKKTMYVGT